MGLNRSRDRSGRYRPPLPVRSLSDQSNGLNAILKLFLARNSFSVVRSLGSTTPSTARARSGCVTRKLPERDSRRP